MIYTIMSSYNIAILILQEGMQQLRNKVEGLEDMLTLKMEEI